MLLNIESSVQKGMCHCEELVSCAFLQLRNRYLPSLLEVGFIPRQRSVGPAFAILQTELQAF